MLDGLIDRHMPDRPSPSRFTACVELVMPPKPKKAAKTKEIPIRILARQTSTEQHCRHMQGGERIINKRTVETYSLSLAGWTDAIRSREHLPLNFD